MSGPYKPGTSNRDEVSCERIIAIWCWISACVIGRPKISWDRPLIFLEVFSSKGSGGALPSFFASSVNFCIPLRSLLLLNMLVRWMMEWAAVGAAESAHILISFCSHNDTAWLHPFPRALRINPHR